MATSTHASGASPKLRLLPLVLLLLLGVAWSLGPSITKFVALAGIAPLGMVFWQTFIAGTVLLLICVVRRIPIRLTGQYWRFYLGMGLIGMAVPNSNMVFVMREIPAGLMSVIILTSPVITYLIALAIRLEVVDIRRASGVLLGFIGAAVLVLPRGSLPAPELLPMALLAFLTPALWASSNVFAEAARPKDGSNYALAMGTMYAAAAGTLIAALASGSFHPLWRDFATVDLVIVGYGFLTVGSFLLFYTIISLAGAVYLAQVGYFITLMGLGWGALFYGERPSAWLWLAIVFVFAGVGLVNLGKRKPEPDDADG